MADLVETSTLRIVVDPSGAKSGSAEAERAINSIGDASDKSAKKLDDFLSKTSKNLISLNSFITSAIDTFLKFATVAVAGAIYALDKLLDRLIDVNVTYNSFIATMTMVKGSVQSAKDEFKYITDYSNKMGASVEDNAKVYIRLAAALKEVDKSGESARHVFEAVSQAQAVLHLKGYETNGIFLAMEQIISKGKLSLEEIQKQLGNRMPEAMGIAARSMNMTQADFRKAITKGSIEPLEFVLKLANQIKIEYGSAAKEAADMFNGQVMRMKNAIFGLYLSVGQTGAMDGLTKIVQALTNMLNDPDVGRQLGESLNRTFSSIAEWISKITATDVKDFFDSIAVTVNVLTDMVGNLNSAFSTTSSDGGTAMIDFMDNFSGMLIIITDMTLTFIAALTSIPMALNSMYLDVAVVAKKFEINRSDNYENELAQLTKERDAAAKMSAANDAILFMTDDSPTKKAYLAKNAAFEKLRQNRLSEAPTLFDESAPTSMNPSDSMFISYQLRNDIYNPKLGQDNISYLFNKQTNIGGPLSTEQLNALAAGGPKAPGGTREPGRGRMVDVFNTESTSLVKAYSIAMLEYNNLMDNQIASENKYLTALNAKISTDKNYKKLSDDQLAQLREKAILADKAALQLKSAEAFSSTRLELNKQLYSQEQSLLDITEQRDSLANKNLTVLQEKFKFDSAYINMSEQMKSSLISQAKANDTLAVSIRNATAVEQSRYATLVNTLEVTRNIDNMNKGLGVNRYNQADKTRDSFLVGGANQFADMATKSKLLADAVKRDFNAMSEDIAQFTFDQKESIDQWNLELDVIGLTTNEINKINESKKIYDYFRLRGIDLSKEENAEYLKTARILSEDMSNALDKVYEKQTNWFTGAKKGFAQYIEDSQNMAKVMEDVVLKSFKGMEDALTDLILKGKASFKDLADSIKADLARAFVKNNITGPLAEWMNGSSSNKGSGGGIGSLWNTASNAYDLFTSSSSAGSIGGGISSMAGSAIGSLGSLLGSAAISSFASGLSGTASGIIAGAGPTIAGSATGLGSLASAAGAGQGAGVLAIGAEAGAGAGAAGMGASISGALAAIPVWGWAALAAAAVAAKFGGGKDRVLGDQSISGALGTNDLTRNVPWTKDGGWFHSDTSGVWNYKLQNSTAQAANGQFYQDTANVANDTAMLKALNDAYTSLKTSASEFAKSLGLNAESIMSRNDQINFMIGKTEAETKANIEKAFATIANSISDSMAVGFKNLAKEGETANQTLARVVTNFKSVNQSFETLNLKLFETSEAGMAAASKFVDLIGGVEALGNVTNSYYTNFFTEEEKLSLLTKQLTQDFAKLNVGEMPKTRDGFKSLVEEISRTGTPEQLAGLLRINQAFANVIPVSESIDKVTEANNLKIISEQNAAAASIRVTQEMERQTKAANELAKSVLQQSYDENFSGRLRSGKISEIMSSNYELNPIDMLSYVGSSGFEAGSFNSELIRQRAKLAVELTDKVSADAINVQNVANVISELFDFTKDREFENELRKSLPADARNQVSKTVGYVFSDFIDASLTGLRLNSPDFTAKGVGISSVITAGEEIQYQKDLQTAYNRSLSSANGMLYLGIITQDEYTEALKRANEILKDNFKSQESLNEAYETAGKLSVAFYFDEISKSVQQLNEVAKEASEPLSQVSESIGRFKSMQYVFDLSAKAAGGDVNAELVAMYAGQAASEITTKDSQILQNKLINTNAFNNVSSENLRDISLLLDGLKEFDSNSLERAFLRITDAFNKGVITQDQYTELFNQSMTAFKGLSNEADILKDSMVSLQKSMQSYADKLLIDRSKTTLSVNNTQNELIRQYEQARVGAMSGEQDAVSKFLSLADQMTDISRFGSRAEYNTAFGKVYGDVRNIESMALKMSSKPDNTGVVEEIKNLQTVITQEVMLALQQIAKNTKDTSNKLDA